MLSIPTVDNDKIISCTAPIQLDDLKKYFTDKSLNFHINYTNSVLQDKKLLVYLSNLGVPCDIILSDTFSFEERSNLLKQYMMLPLIIDVPLLNLAASLVIFKAKGYNIEDAYPNPYFSEQEVNKFLIDYDDMIQKWIKFLDSCTIYAQKCIPELNSKEFLVWGIEIISDREYVGYSIVKLFSLSFFFNNYYKKPLGPLAYFELQFEDYMFQGKNLYHYFASKNNILLPLLRILGQDTNHDK